MSSPLETMSLFSRKEVTPPSEKALQPGERVQVNLDAPLTSRQETQDALGINGVLVATINAGSKDFLVLDTRGSHTTKPFLIIDETFSKQDKIGFKGIAENKFTVIGRDHCSDRFIYPDTMSREHFALLYADEELLVRNLRPTNKTLLTAHLVTHSQPGQFLVESQVEDLRTRQVEARLQAHPNFGEKDDTAPYGYYMNHQILGRASNSVDDGVYLGGSAREAIVVDGKSVILRQVYDSIANELRQSFDRNETLTMRAILLKVMHKIQEVMPYDDQKTEHISRQHYGDKLVGLSSFVKERAGVCRHQGLLAAYIIESLIKDGHILGSVGIERNTVEEMGGTHAWAVYKASINETKEVIVVDPAQSFVGTKKQAQREKGWEYYLTTDQY